MNLFSFLPFEIMGSRSPGLSRVLSLLHEVLEIVVLGKVERRASYILNIQRPGTPSAGSSTIFKKVLPKRDEFMGSNAL